MVLLFKKNASKLFHPNKLIFHKSFPGKNSSSEPFPVMVNKIGEICRWILDAPSRPFQSLYILFCQRLKSPLEFTVFLWILDLDTWYGSLSSLKTLKKPGFNCLADVARLWITNLMVLGGIFKQPLKTPHLQSLWWHFLFFFNFFHTCWCCSSFGLTWFQLS